MPDKQLSLFHHLVARKRRGYKISRPMLGISPPNKMRFTDELDAILVDAYINKCMSSKSAGKTIGIGASLAQRRLLQLGVKLRKQRSGGFSKQRPASPETIAKRANTMRGRKRAPFWTKESLQKLSESVVRSYSNHYPYKCGRHYSPKLNAEIPCRSSYEKKYMEYLDADQNVAWYEHEPKSVKITYEFNGVVKRYIPDFLVTYSNGDKKLVEVKSDYTVRFEKTTEKMNALRDFVLKSGEINSAELVMGEGDASRDTVRLRDFIELTKG